MTVRRLSDDLKARETPRTDVVSPKRRISHITNELFDAVGAADAVPVVEAMRVMFSATKYSDRVVPDTVRENVCNKAKNAKSHVFWILKKNVTKRKKT